MEFKKGRYRHYKGNFYEVLDVVRHSETEEELVLYKQLYGDRALWVRPYNNFYEIIERAGEQKHRFAFVDNTTTLSKD